MSFSIKNYIYSGTIQHQRHTPFNHSFKYPIFMIYFNIKTIDNLFKKSWLWNINKPSIISFYRKDYHGNCKKSLDSSVRETIYNKTGKKIKGPIRILTHLRYFGYCFNPVSFYYCFDKLDKKVELIMAEVTNTPWNERHTYIISDIINDKNQLKINIDKEFHVSPFWGMDHNYEWIFSQPTKQLFVYMQNFINNDKVFEATLNLKRKPLNMNNLVKQTLRFPFITLRIVFRIHWQAAKLWIKGAPFFTHPKKINT